MSDCLDNLIGLTDVDCECFEDDRPEDYDTSTSGYYLTDADEGFNILEALASGLPCGDANIWDAMVKARDKAIVRLRTDYVDKLREVRRPRLNTFNSVIGKITANQIVATAFPYAGVKMLLQEVKGGEFVIEEFYIGLDKTKTVTLNIVSNDPLFTPIQVTGTTEAGKFKSIEPDNPIVLPMYSDLVLNNTGDERLKYWIWYEIPTESQPLNNRWVCCGANPNWKAHLDISGFTTNDVTVPIESGGGGSAMGIAIRGYFKCNDLDWFCNIDKEAGISYRNVLAKALQAKSAAYLMNYVLNKQDVNQYTLMNRNEMHDKRAYLEQRYLDYMTWLIDNYPTKANDCFVCIKKIERKSLMI